MPLIVVASSVGEEPPSDAANSDAANSDATDSQAALNALVPKLRSKHKLVGLATMLMVDSNVIAKTADGERSKGSGVSVEITDRWHIGSITKSITATMISRLVERGKLGWSTTVGETLGESITVNSAWNDVTLEQLLTHSSGAPSNFSFTTQFNRPPEGEKRTKARLAAVAGVVATKPLSEPGKKFRYSNVGFTLAGVMAEKVTGTAWEDLVRKEVFKPLKLEHTGFGPPTDSVGKKLSQPRGHQNIGPFKRTVGVDEDNTPIIGPAGTVHMTLTNLCEFGHEHMVGEMGRGKLLKAKTYKRLHTAKLNDYAFGLFVPEETRWTKQRIIWHNGSNTMWYALLVILPEKNAVLAVTSNDGDIRQAEKAAFEILKELADTL